MFLAYLIGTEGWCTDKFRLTWKIQAKKSHQPVLLACAVGGPHLRFRLWFVAYAHQFGQLGYQTTEKKFNNDDW